MIRPIHFLILAGALALFAPRAGAQQPATTAFTAERLLATLTRDLTARFRLEGDLQLELLRPWTAPARAAADWKLEIVECPALPTTTLIVRCRLLADGVEEADTTLLFRAALWRDSWFTRQPVAAGAGFDPSVLEARRVDCLRDRDALPAAAGDRSFMFARDVGADRMITWRDIARRPLVRKGDVIDVVAAEGPLLVTLKALALQNGGQGDLVTVRNLETRKDIAALVVAENRVAVHF